MEKFFPKEQTVAVLKPGLNPEIKGTNFINNIIFFLKIKWKYFKEEIEKKIKEKGFSIVSRKSEKLSQDLAKEMYKYHKDKDYFNDLVEMMTR